MGASASHVRCHGYRGDRAVRRLARADAGQLLGITPDTVRRRPRADTLAGEREPTQPRFGIVNMPDDAQGGLRPGMRRTSGQTGSCHVETGSRAGGPAGTGDGLRHALARSRAEIRRSHTHRLRGVSHAAIGEPRRTRNARDLGRFA